MLIKYGFKNFFSFKEESFISFELDKNVPDDVSQGRSFTTIMGIKGANSSGKTNIIKALSFLSEFITSSSNKEKYKLAAFPFFDSKEKTFLYAELGHAGKQYRYEVEIFEKEVISEKVFRKNRKWVPILSREKTDITYAISDFEKSKEIKISKDASAISTLSNFRMFDSMLDLKNIYDCFDNVIYNVSASDGMLPIPTDFRKVSGIYNIDKRIFEFTKSFLQKADPTLIDIEINQDVDKDGEERFTPIFIHQYADNRKKLQFRDESSGTKTLYIMLCAYQWVIYKGGVLALDEFDIHLHAMLLPHILKLFTDPENNSKNSQFIFTAHNTEIIDELGRYRTTLVNKEDCESYCYRLDEIGGQILRNDRPISPIYTKGLIGGTPQL
ncbi:ATP/GTP-binding protein [Pseudomonas sp. NPDC089401]|uniref:AAA family ATPase n=1 Tax=Pseudomonas sp. NPDC089401 TaxID=3364462 RepID=UPI003816889C